MPRACILHGDFRVCLVWEMLPASWVNSIINRHWHVTEEVAHWINPLDSIIQKRKWLDRRWCTNSFFKPNTPSILGCWLHLGFVKLFSFAKTVCNNNKLTEIMVGDFLDDSRKSDSDDSMSHPCWRCSSGIQAFVLGHGWGVPSRACEWQSSKIVTMICQDVFVALRVSKQTRDSEVLLQCMENAR
jgi:hypothetical protein